MGCSTSTEEQQIRKNNSKNPSVKKDGPKKILTHNDILIEQQNLVGKNSGKIKEIYRFIEVIDRGAFGTYYKVHHNRMDIDRVCKVVPKEVVKYREGTKTFQQEIEILSMLDHPNIIKLYDCFEEDNNYYIVTEYCTGGQLYDQILRYQNFTEVNAAIIIKQVLSAIYYLHEHDIIHRDIKPESILMESNKLGDFYVKLIDFGTAIFGETSNDVNLLESSPYYQAPEISKKIISSKCDTWSCGIILYILLCGYPPFRGSDQYEIMYLAEQGKYDFESIEWDNISDLAKNFVRKLLDINYETRYSAEDALQDPWIKKMMSSELAQPEISKKVTASVFKNLKNFTAKQKLQQAAIAFIVHQMTTNEHTRELREIFQKIDKNHEGRLSIPEITQAYQEYFKNEFSSMKELEKALNLIDQDQNGFIEYEEFLRATMRLDLVLTENNLDLAFEFFDYDKTGYLSHNNLVKALGLASNNNSEGRESNIVKNLIKEVDLDGNGKISKEEFKVLMRKAIEEGKN